MLVSEAIRLRLYNQQILRSSFKTPEEVVSWFGAIQAQDYTAAKWALGLRLQNINDAQIEEAFNQGRILRTHVMRPTWHFVTPENIQWMLLLTKDRVHKVNSSFYRQLGLDISIFQKCINLIRRRLEEKTYLRREEIRHELNKKFNFTNNTSIIISCILMYAELEGVICSGPRRGKQFTYALFDERVPKAKLLDAETALKELTKRYFQSHGPATLRDFIWWSGLTPSNAKKGIEIIKRQLNREKIGENVYWFINSETAKEESKIFLLPNYDEYIVGYTDRTFIFDNAHIPHLDARANPLFQHTIIYNGRIIGTWKRELIENSVTVSTNIFEPLDNNDEKLLKHAIEQFGGYVNKPVKKLKL